MNQQKIQPNYVLIIQLFCFYICSPIREGIFYCLKFFWNLGVQKCLLIPNKWRVFEKWRQFCRQLTWTQNIFWNDDGTFAVTKNIYKNFSEMIPNSASLGANIMRGLFELFVNISESGCNFVLSQCK